MFVAMSDQALYAVYTESIMNEMISDKTCKGADLFKVAPSYETSSFESQYCRHGQPTSHVGQRLAFQCNGLLIKMSDRCLLARLFIYIKL
jgi:hypothetical protein